MQATLIKLLQQCHWRNCSVVIITFWHDISLYLGVLLFIPLAKGIRSRDSKHRTVPYPTIYWEFSKNYKSTFLKNVFGWLLTFLLKQWQKQPIWGVPMKRCSENMQQISRRTPTPKCDFNKVANRTSARVFSCKFAAYFRNTFT